ncbi:MAG TPA: hypothetical protein DCR17_02080 [Verrucomicrobiales bacterium]|jgi:hypothetical protein|nr:hypothetical protein [Pedosphaera sp.]MBL6844761.1 HEAT repeat domain-containing protein [Verrucomicrobiae bacterium]RZO68828.1 MAG: hypothetical protein EVA71_09395 [Limisphaerales bacterium]HAO65464.1 hypothetical protein [Verrucomicrobiales bacterium]HAR00533.1 hypothetical protein [Verrucomicrobiales bacterium]|tara:strand:- start:3697 stop:4083 length:387 start_codon:yes stop_codon:yes gene_type:complete
MRISRQQKLWTAWGGCALLIAMLAIAYFSGHIQFMNPANALRSQAEPDRFDGLIYIANKGTEGRRWQYLVIQTLSNDPSPDIREMAVITLRELGKDAESMKCLRKCLATEKEAIVKEAIKDLLWQWQP